MDIRNNGCNDNRNGVFIDCQDSHSDKDMEMDFDAPKLLLDKEALYYSSDTGRLFTYDTSELRADWIQLGDNHVPLTGTPVQWNGSIYILNTKAEIYKLTNP